MQQQKAQQQQVQTSNEKLLWVPKVPQVLNHTARIAVQYAPVPSTGMVYYSMGTVWENPTHELPILNPKGIQHHQWVTPAGCHTLDTDYKIICTHEIECLNIEV